MSPGFQAAWQQTFQGIMCHMFQVSFLNNNRNPREGLCTGKSLLTPVFQGNKSEEMEGWRPKSSHQVLRSSDFLASLRHISAFPLIIYKLSITKRPATGGIISRLQGSLCFSDGVCGERCQRRPAEFITTYTRQRSSQEGLNQRACSSK